jgi:UDP-N-acetylmuramoyl-L-alanyl-D-glutamate--2,6-diaminopimelate ligase
MRLFSEVLEPKGVMIIPSDTPFFSLLVSLARKKEIEITAFGKKYSNYKGLWFVGWKPHPTGKSTFVFELNGKEVTIHVPLIGSFQASNLLCALGICLASGVDSSAAISALHNIQCVSGRMEAAEITPSGARIYIDYAHTPDALEKALCALRPYTQSKLWLVFGAGGERDICKRLLMGEIAACYADNVIVTDDSPRGEDPALIRQAIKQGCPHAIEIGDRYEAIKTAVKGLRKEDVLLIAGRGCEKKQIIGQEVLDFSDLAVSREILSDI